MASGDARRKFVTPLGSLPLVGCLIAHGAVAVIASVVAGAWAMNTLFDAQWSMLKPAIALAIAFCCSFALFWPLGIPEPLRNGLATLSAAAMAAMIILWSTQSDALDGSPVQNWGPIHEMEWLLAGLLALGTVALAVWNFSRARRGGDIELGAFLTRIWERLASCWPAGGVFRSRSSAEGWYEWREKGIVLPIASVVLGIPAFVWLVVNPHLVEGSTLLGSSAWLVIMTAPFGFFLGAAGPNGGIREFKAARPLTDIQLTDSILRNTARSLLVTWALWSAMLILLLVWRQATGRTVDISIGEFFVWCGMVLASWGFAANAAVLILLPQRLGIIYAACAIVGVFLLPGLAHLVSFLTAQDKAQVFTALGMLLLVGLMGLAGGTLVTSRRVRLVSDRRFRVILVLMATTFVALLAAALWQVGLDEEPLEYAVLVGVVIVAAAYAWLPLAAAPLAVWWSRHR